MIQLTSCAVMVKSERTGRGSVGWNSIPRILVNGRCELDRKRRNRTGWMLSTGRRGWNRSISKEHLRERSKPQIYADHCDMRLVVFLVVLVIVCKVVTAQTPTPNKQIVIAASTVLDGKGGV